MYRAEIPSWEFWEDGRWPVRPSGVPYPKGEARVIEKEPVRKHRTSWQLDAVWTMLKKAKATVRHSAYYKVVRGTVVYFERDGVYPHTMVRYVPMLRIEADIPPVKRRKRKAKTYTHPHDGLPHCPQGGLIPCNHWGCR